MTAINCKKSFICIKVPQNILSAAMKRRAISLLKTVPKYFQVDPEFAHLPVKERWRLSQEKRQRQDPERSARNTKVEARLFNPHPQPSF